MLKLIFQGFCIPSELAANEEGSQKDNPAGGLGLGEGVGEKDISEQIDSEEQLEDARPKGEEKEEDDKDCKACLKILNPAINLYCAGVSVTNTHTIKLLARLQLWS